jgi:hypothetical protein
MAKKLTITISWRKQPEKHTYKAAESYLNLMHRPREAEILVAKLRKSRVTQFMAKDIFRASRLSLLGVSNSHIERVRKKIADGTELSPLLLVRNERCGWVVIADGYHRLCAVYSIDEDAWIPCKIV